MKNVIAFSRLVLVSVILFFSQACLSQIDLSKKLPIDPNVKVGKTGKWANVLYKKECKT